MSIKDHKYLKTTCKMLRLLCLNSKVNTNMIAGIAHKLLEYNYYFNSILILIKNNHYFGIEFQKRGWYHIIISKLALLQST